MCYSVLSLEEIVCVAFELLYSNRESSIQRLSKLLCKCNKALLKKLDIRTETAEG